MHKNFIVCLLLLLIAACETPGSKTLKLDPRLSVEFDKQALGFLVMSTENNAKKPRLDSREIEVPIADKVKLVKELFREGFTRQGWTVIEAGSPLLPVPNPKSVSVGMSEFLVYLVPNVTHDTVYVQFSLTLSYAKEEKTVTRTYNKRSNQNFPVKAGNEDVKEMVELTLSDFIVDILKKNHLLESQ